MNMLKMTILSGTLLLSGSLIAGDPVTVNSKITDVTVFLRGAEITMTANTALISGKQELVFEKLAEGINPQSIQATAPADVIILEVSHEINYLKTGIKSARIIQLEDSVKWLNNEITKNRNAIWVLDGEEKMILANQSLKGNDVLLTAEEIRKGADFFRQRLTDIIDRKFEYNQAIEKLTMRLARVQNQQQELNYRDNQPSNDIVVKVQAQRNGTFPVSIRFFTNNAYWTPRYDLRADKIGKPVNLDYRADIVQNTGTDWDQVMLTLSSSNPNQGGTQPLLSTWYIDIMQAYTRTLGYAGEKGKSAPSAAYDSKEEEVATNEYSGETGMEDFGEATTIADYTSVSEHATAVLYAIKLPQSIPSDSKKHQVHIEKHELGAEYRHYAVPKLDCDAFLLAKVTDWEKLNLLPGNASIYFEGTFVGQAMLDPDLTRDTIDISLGRDPKVVITREQLKNFTRDKTVGGTRVRTFGYEITVRNTKSEKIQLTLKDQLPVSNNKEIVVTLLDKDGEGLDIVPMPSSNAATGELQWKLDLAPQETKKMKFFFEVRFPKDQQISGIW